MRLPEWMRPQNDPYYPDYMVWIFWACVIAVIIGFAGVVLSETSKFWVMFWFGWELFFGINMCYIAIFKPIYFPKKKL